MTFADWYVDGLGHPNNPNTFTVNRAQGYGGSVISNLNLYGGTVKADMTFSSWELSGTNAFFAINFRDSGNNSFAQLRFQGNDNGTRVVLDGEIGQITDVVGGQRDTAVGGFVSTTRADTTPVTISITLGIDDGSYLLESSIWTSQNFAQQEGFISNPTGATIDNFRWMMEGGWVYGTDFVELDNITISTGT